ncbi:MmgE/PrpD family protein [Glaciibacter sp. 2TAF33]|uniref:MmgE/PrpD family protein n=1 Tax=Glaciibacter sp. 2TAF33 TaxID=3233015 RepID=UPI003F92C918
MTDATIDVGVTEALALFAVGGLSEADDHSAAVTRALLDTVAVALGAAGSDGERILRAWAGQEASTGVSTVWTSGGTASSSVAALVNGTAAHLLDFDDVSPSMPLHPSAVLMPALVAVAEARGTSSGRFIAAYNVGAAVFRAVSELLPQHVHYARGWHTTSTVGRLATVAALVRLVGADVETARHALGIASSLAAGSRPNFGSMTKPLHAGAAARDGVMALELAEAGFTANPEELEAPSGFLERYGDPDAAPVGDAAETLAERLDYWGDAWVANWGLKRYPSCYGTHRGIDAILELRAAGPSVSPVQIRATLHPRGTRPLRSAPPTTPTQAKFSLEYTLAAAYLRGPVTLADFTDEAFEDPSVQDLMRSVVIGESPVPPFGPATFSTGYTVVEITFADGTTRSSRVDVTHGQASDPLTDAELHAKFIDCCVAGGYLGQDAERVFTAITAEPGAAFTSTIQKRTLL